MLCFGPKKPSFVQKAIYVVRLAQEPARLHGAKMSNPEQYLKSGMMFRGFDQDRELISVAEN